MIGKILENISGKTKKRKRIENVEMISFFYKEGEAYVYTTSGEEFRFKEIYRIQFMDDLVLTGYPKNITTIDYFRSDLYFSPPVVVECSYTEDQSPYALYVKRW